MHRVLLQPLDRTGGTQLMLRARHGNTQRLGLVAVFGHPDVGSGGSE